VPVFPFTDCTGAAAAAPLALTNPESLVKLLTFVGISDLSAKVPPDSGRLT
jgi:hypothetical protein